ncbi:thioredoxin family protein [Orrella sp. JC864]|uniref:thioredoxin family protein n=1 Tax=Orrella sp. JC864 TaxID=3120298 RepID=UPI00300B1A6F
MPVYFPDTARLPATQLPEAPSLVVCYCAEWCGTCRQYQPLFEALAHRRGDYVFAWVDIEDHPELLGEQDVENFPTVLVMREGRTVFYGTLLPHIGHLERLLDAPAAHAPQGLPDVPALLSRLPAAAGGSQA